MRSIVVCTLALVSSACGADGAPAPSRPASELASCGARMVASPEFQALKANLAYGNSPARKATPDEARHMTRLHHEHLRPCQEIQLEIAGRTHPSLPPLYNAAAARADVEIAKLVRQEITWAEFGASTATIRRELNAQLRARRDALGLPSLNGLDRPSPD